MGERADIAEAHAEVFDAKREVLFPEGSSLVLVLDAGTDDETDVAVEGGWISERQQRFGEPASIRLIKVTERGALTSEVMGRADRLKLNGVIHQFNFDPPVEDPWWTLYATEMKSGGVR